MSQREWVEKDYYAALGVDKKSSQAEIDKAFRKLAQKNHPDTNPGDARAEERFKEISQAHDVIGDPAKRKEYDQMREMLAGGFRGFSGGPQGVRIEDLFDTGGNSSAGFEDLFSGIFGAGSRSRTAPRGADYETEISLDFMDAMGGTTITLPLSVGGRTRQVKVRIPAGVKDGARIKVGGRGEQAAGAVSGDLYVRVKVNPHRFFGRKGKDVTLQVPLTYTEAALGADIEVPTMDGGPVKVKIPAGTQPGKTFRLRGKGPVIAGANSDLLVSVQVSVPSHLSKKQRELLKDLDEAFEHPSVRAELERFITEGKHA
ncbi:MAG: DnaJ C-terminal domain-containing protein [Actinomycetota bacterium]